MTVTAPHPPASTERVIELLSNGTTTLKVAELTGWPRQRILALITGRKGWLLSAATDTVYCPADDDPIEDPGATAPRATQQPRPAVRDTEPDVDELLARAAELEDKAVARELKRATEAIARLRTLVAAVQERRAAEQQVAELEAQLAAAKARLKKTGGVRRAASSAPPAGGRPSPKQVRAWAAAQGIEVSAKGKVPESVVERYQAAHKAGS